MRSYKERIIIMHRFKSCAEWEAKHRFYENKTTDTHETKEHAEAVCRGLERDGLGGEKIHFPLKTWVEELKEVPTPDGFGLVWVLIAQRKNQRERSESAGLAGYASQKGQLYE